MIGHELSYLLCGLLAGLLGGYLGMGGGILIVPYLTMVAGVDLKAAIPASVTAIVVNSLSSSTEYIRKGMVNFELAVSLGIAMTLGNVAGSVLGPMVSASVTQFLFGCTLLYTAYTFVRKNESTAHAPTITTHKYYWGVMIASFGTGVLGALLGVGGGIIIIPLMFVVFGLPLATARGTSSFIIGFSSSAAVAVYLIAGQIDLSIVPALLVGTIIGGKAGGYFGTLARPKAVKFLFAILLLYLAGRFIYLSVR